MPRKVPTTIEQRMLHLEFVAVVQIVLCGLAVLHTGTRVCLGLWALVILTHYQYSCLFVTALFSPAKVILIIFHLAKKFNMFLKCA